MPCLALHSRPGCAALCRAVRCVPSPLTTLPLPALPSCPPQIYRAEYWSKQLGAKQALPMLSMSLLMIAGISLASTFAVHPQAALRYLSSPQLLTAAVAESQ